MISLFEKEVISEMQLAVAVAGAVAIVVMDWNKCR